MDKIETDQLHLGNLEKSQHNVFQVYGKLLAKDMQGNNHTNVLEANVRSSREALECLVVTCIMAVLNNCTYTHVPLLKIGLSLS